MALVTAALLTVFGVSTGAGATASAAADHGPVTAWGYRLRTSVPAGLDAIAIASGHHHSLALTPDGRVVAWGVDEDGETDVPTSLAGKTVTAISAGTEHSLALTSDGQVTAWGGNRYHQTDVPASLSGRTVTAISAGDYHNLALTSDGHVTAWGNDDQGATQVPASLNDKTVTAISAGAQYGLALTSDGHITVWGWDHDGLAEVPRSLSGKTVTTIEAGGTHILALTSDGQLTSWGDDDYGSARISASSPSQSFIAISANQDHDLALTSDGKVRAWGNNDFGQSEVPASLTGRTVVDVAAGYMFSMALTRAVAPAVTSSPTSADLRVGQLASFTAVAAGNPAPTVQWQRADPGGAFSDVSGATTLRYTFATAGSDDGARFRAVFTSSAGTTTSSTATLTVVNSTPVGKNVSVTAGFEAPTSVTLSGTDADDDTLTYAVGRQPKHGTLSGQAPGLSYTPADGYTGGDSFTYRVNDGTISSAPARVAVTVTAQSCVPTTPERTFRVNADRRDSNGVLRSPKLTTRKPGELLVAFVAVNGPSPGTQSVTAVTGGGLTWTLVQRDSSTSGSSEIWQAYAAKKLRSTRVAAHLTAPGYTVTMTVAGFSGARPRVGAAAHQSGAQSAPRVTLTPQASGSAVWAVGRVIGSRYDPRPVLGQSIVHDKTFTSPKAGYWTQRIAEPSTVGTDLTVGDRAIGRTWGYTAVEIRGTCR